MHITDAIGVLGYAKPKGFHNVIVDVFHVIYKGGLVLLQHDIPQLEPNITPEVIA